jgi:hypothetical protein
MRYALFSFAFLFACADAGSHDGLTSLSPCLREPDPAARTFIVGQQIGTERIEGVLAEIEDLPHLGGLDYRFETAEGAKTLRWMSAEPLFLTTGRTYELRVDYFPGAPDASGLVILEEGNLVFASLNDQRPGQRALKEGIPGFTFEVLPSECPSREPTQCHESLKNAAVRVGHCGESVQLYQGQTGLLCDAEVRILVAQEVEYSRACADAGLPGISLTVKR